MRFNIFACVLIISLSPTTLLGDVIINSIDGNVVSEFDTVSDNTASSMLTMAITSNIADNNSFTQSDANWDWAADTLTGSALITTEKTISARPGGDHRGTSVLTVVFTVDANTNFELSGTWGFDTASGTNDTLGYQLTGTGGIVVSDASTGTTGISSDTFTSTGLLTAGTYTLTFNSELIETINNQGSRLAGWTLDAFTLTTVAVPESSTVMPLLFIFGTCVSRRRRTLATSI